MEDGDLERDLDRRDLDFGPRDNDLDFDLRDRDLDPRDLDRDLDMDIDLDPRDRDLDPRDRDLDLDFESSDLERDLEGDGDGDAIDIERIDSFERRRRDFRDLALLWKKNIEFCKKKSGFHLQEIKLILNKWHLSK